MANESVTHDTTPGWADLLTNDADYGMPTSRDTLKRLEEAANNVISSILDGIAAVGELQWRAAQYTDAPVEAHTVFVLGDFQLTLANLIVQLRGIETDANFARHELELAEVKGEAIA